MFLCFLLTRVGNVNDSVFFDSGQLDRLDDWLDLKPDKEVGKEAKDILPKNNEIKIKSLDYVCKVHEQKSPVLHYQEQDVSNQCCQPDQNVKQLPTLAFKVYFAFATDLMTISSYLPNRFVQVHDVLDGKVAHVEGEYVFAKSMQKLDVV